MPPRRTKDAQHAVDMRQLMEDCHIDFKGPVEPSSWPTGRGNYYYNAFSKISSIGRHSYETYEGNENTDELSVRKLRKRTIKLRRKAWLDRRLRVNEETLRGSTEDLVFSRFGTEIKCSVCRKYLWLSSFKACPSDLEEAARLEKSRAKRGMCQCGSAPRTWDDFEDPGETFLFFFHNSEVVLNHPSEAKVLKERGLGDRKPDKVFGLNRTKKVQHYARAMDQIRHSPFAKQSLIYPFLIVEAKSEEGSVGFEAIEAQTAFPIRTCLKLQEDLCEESGIEMDPLVWFMSYQGDEWRLAACVVNDQKYEIYDLWMGRTLSVDGAMQLLLIVDYLCDWAREVHRFEVLRCLARGEQIDRNLSGVDQNGDRHRSPTYASRSSTHGSQPKSPISARGDLRSREMSALSLLDSPTADSQMDDAFEVVALSQDLASDADEHVPHREIVPQSDYTHPWLRWINADEHEWPWAKAATIRHVNMVLFQYNHLAIPEEDTTLISYLRQLQTKWSIAEMASSILSAILDDSGLTVTLQDILHVKSMWLKKDHSVTRDSDDPVRVIFFVRSFFRFHDHQIVRTFNCISCTQKAMESLAWIAHADNGTLQEAHGLFKRGDLSLLEAIDAFRSLTGSNSLAYAFEAMHGYPELEQDRAKECSHITLAISKAKSSISQARAWQIFDQLDRLPLARVMFDNDCALMEVLPKPLSRKITGWPTHVLPRSQEAVLCRINPRTAASDASQSSKRWCLIALQEVEFDDNKELARILRGAADAAMFEVAGSEGMPEIDTLEVISFDDIAFLRDWEASLMTHSSD